MELLLSRENTANTHPLLESSDRSYCNAGLEYIHIQMYTPALELTVVDSRIFNLTTLTLNHGLFFQRQLKVLIFIRKAKGNSLQFMASKT